MIHCRCVIERITLSVINFDFHRILIDPTAIHFRVKIMSNLAMSWTNQLAITADLFIVAFFVRLTSHNSICTVFSLTEWCALRYIKTSDLSYLIAVISWSYQGRGGIARKPCEPR